MRSLLRKQGYRWAQGLYALLMLSPIFVLFFYSNEGESVDAILFAESISNTFLLVSLVILCSTLVGVSFSLFNAFYNYPLKRVIHIFLMLPLSLPAYVLAFLYISLWGMGDHFPYVNVQGELWFLIFILTLSLTPYVYFFSSLGLKQVTQSEVEVEQIINRGIWPFFRVNVFPKIFPFLVSAQILVCFEALADFGAASVVNVPVLTTMIYKVWFDLFSFSGAVSLCLKYSLFIFLILIVEVIVKSKVNQETQLSRDPVRGKELMGFKKYIFLASVLSFILISFLLPAFMIIKGAVYGFTIALGWGTLVSSGWTFLLAFLVSVLALMVSVALSLVVRSFSRRSRFWSILSTIGYSIPGTILAVSAYAILLSLFSDLSALTLFVSLVVALSYKFLTVSLRPISEAVQNIPSELDEVSKILGVSYIKRIRTYILPYTKESLIVGLLLVMIEVMKEMPLTLMLAPSEIQTLSIQIFNYTSEGEWLKASLPSLLLMLIGVVSVLLIHLREKKI